MAEDASGNFDDGEEQVDGDANEREAGSDSKGLGASGGERVELDNWLGEIGHGERR